MQDGNPGAHERPTDTDAQRCKDTSDHDVVVAAGGATVGQQMKLHEPGCPCLGNAVETRPPTAGERRSREWCETCKGDVTQTPSFDAYNALVAAAEDDDVDRGDGIETDGGRDSPQGALRITLDRDDINALLDDGTKVVEKDVGPITVNLRTHQQLNAVVTVSGRRKDPDPERVDE